MDKKTRNSILEILAALQLKAWNHAIEGQHLLSRIRELETMFKAEDAKEDKKNGK